MTRKQLLEAAEQVVCNNRDKQYGSPEKSFACISDLWTVYLAHKKSNKIYIEEVDVAVMMALLKIARIATGQSKADNFIDLAGYAACGCEMATEE